MKFLAVAITIILIVLLNIYLFRGINGLIEKKKNKKLFQILFWVWTIPLPLLIIAVAVLPTEYFKGVSRSIILTYTVFDIIGKIILLLFFVLDDLIHFSTKKIKEKKGKQVYDESRKQFIKKTGIAISVLPVAGFSFGIVSGAHNYNWHRLKVKIPNLPNEFHGLKIGQISDLHSGSFSNLTAVKGGIDMFMSEKPDIVFFTGDIVNDQAWEIKAVFDIYKNVKAPLGVYSILGNHDYGDYSNWKSQSAKMKNFQGILDAHQNLGWDLLRNENRIVEIGKDRLAIIGVENWGAKMRFQKHGDLEKAKKGTEGISTKLLLSHDPSHWEAQVIPEHPDIDLMFAGHTHGFQFGIETPLFRWSPAQYLYPQWAGLYKKGNQQLYVNRGFGFIGYPGRIGILPELTLIELVKE
ncbi:metallophosphoesterase [Hyphobacterium sp. CCMP332]|nr:metallophosphoesterase [Hyphobacterium sp. CCMP332]